jgi:hypothetical protein
MPAAELKMADVELSTHLFNSSQTLHASKKGFCYNLLYFLLCFQLEERERDCLTR